MVDQHFTDGVSIGMMRTTAPPQGNPMSVFALFKRLHLVHFSKPAGERAIWKTVLQTAPRRIVELGIGDGVRTQRMLALASETTTEKVQYTGQDLFEGRPDGQPGLKLKDAHRAFATNRISSRLAPGDVHSVLSRMANSLTKTDLLLISNEHDASVLAAAWYYVPRMLHEESMILVQASDEAGAYAPVERSEVDRLAAAAARPVRSAA